MNAYYVFPGLKSAFQKKIRRTNKAFITNMDERILQKICDHYGYSMTQLKNENRSRPLVFVRQLATVVLRRRAEMPVERIGKLLGKHHTTVVHSCKQIQDYLDIGYREDEIRFFLNYDY